MAEDAFEIIEFSPTVKVLQRYGEIPMRVEVHAALHAEPLGLGGIALHERPVPSPYTKDYDVDGDRPVEWPACFDVSRWGFFLAERRGQPWGGAAVAFDTEGVDMLERRRDIGVLWDLRVHPDAARRGIGRALVCRAADWLRARGARWLKIETQNINLPACRFYQSLGCELGGISRFAYPELPHEVMLLWYLDLAS